MPTHLLQQAGADPGSFRDPAGRVYHCGGRVFRMVARERADAMRRIRATPLVEALIHQGRLVDAVELSPTAAGFDPGPGWALFEHPRLPFISYPYEWGFAALRDAALHHLDLQLELLDADIVLCDATAYNIQFIGARPIFIDFLSLRPLTKGEAWAGHRQFRQQFLNPLLLRAYAGVPHNAWYRGSPEGLQSDQLRRVLPLSCKWRWLIFSEVVLPAWMEVAVTRDRGSRRLDAWKPALSRSAYQALLVQLRRSIARLKPAGPRSSAWSDYAEANSYTDETRACKERLVRSFVQEERIATLWDIGCNTGHYAAIALEAGADAVIGFDADDLAADAGHARAKQQQINLTCLVMDATNQSPAQGWRQAERLGLDQRSGADGVMALALVHHLAIGRNIPLEQIVQWLTRLAPSGIVEFVAKDDAMVQRLLASREDIFPDYGLGPFRVALAAEATVVEESAISDTRTLLRFRL